MSTNAGEGKSNLSCSFCGKSQREVRKLIAGPSVYICDECIGLCNDIIADELESGGGGGALTSGKGDYPRSRRVCDRSRKRKSTRCRCSQSPQVDRDPPWSRGR